MITVLSKSDLVDGGKANSKFSLKARRRHQSHFAIAMQRAPRGISIPSGSKGQELAASKCFEEFLVQVNMNIKSLDQIHACVKQSVSAPQQNFYSLLTAFSIFLQTKTSAKSRASDGLLAKATAVGYFSQVVNYLRETYAGCLSDSKRVGAIRDAMAKAIEERNLLANIQTNDAPGCKIGDLLALVKALVVDCDVGSGFKWIHDAAILTMMWHTFGRAIDTCFARKSQLTVTASGELFLRVARIKTSVVQGLSMYKSAEHWQQCVFHAFGMLFICSSEPSEYIFPNVPRLVEPEVPGGRTLSQEEAFMYWERLQKQQDVEEAPTEQQAKRVRTRPNVSKYINDIINEAVGAAKRNEYPHELTSRLSSHSLRRGAAAYANASPKLAIQWISTRGAWLLESLSKVFAYIGTTTREDQHVAKVLAGYKDPDLPVKCPSVVQLKARLDAQEYGQLIALRGELFRNSMGFTGEDAKLNVAVEVIDGTFGAVLIHLREVLQETQKRNGNQGQTSFYIYRFYRAIDSTNAKLGCHLTLDSCCRWGDLLAEAWKFENFLQLGSSSGGCESVMAATMTQMLAAIHTMQATIERLTETQAVLVDRLESQASGIAAVAPINKDVNAFHELVAPKTSSLAGCFKNWFELHLWNQASEKREQSLRSEIKACVNIMIALSDDIVIIPKEPSNDEGAYDAWSKEIWRIAHALDRKANVKLHGLDGKQTTKRASSLRKRWAANRKANAEAVNSICSRYLERKASGQILDRCTPPSHQWSALDLM